MKYKFIEIAGLSNRLVLSNTSYVFRSGVEYDENSIKKFIELFPNRFEKIETIKEEVVVEAKEEHTSETKENEEVEISNEVEENENETTEIEYEITENEDVDECITKYLELNTKKEKEDYLNNLSHWKKIEQIAEYFEINYTNKKATIKAILKK